MAGRRQGVGPAAPDARPRARGPAAAGLRMRSYNLRAPPRRPQLARPVERVRTPLATAGRAPLALRGAAPSIRGGRTCAPPPVAWASVTHARRRDTAAGNPEKHESVNCQITTYTASTGGCSTVTTHDRYNALGETHRVHPTSPRRLPC